MSAPMSARILDARGQERRRRAVDKAQPHATRRQLIGADRRGRVAERTRPVLDTEKGNHAVLLNAVSRHPDSTDQRTVAIERRTSRENLQAVGELCPAAGDGGQSGTADIGATDCWRRRPSGTIKNVGFNKIELQ